MLRYCYSLLVLGFLAFAERVKADSSSSFTASSLSKGQPAIYTFSFNTQIDIRYESDFLVSFPDGFTQTSPDLRCVVTQVGQAPFFSGCDTLNSYPLKIAVHMDRIFATRYTIYLADVINPSNVTSTVGFNISTVLQNGIIEEIDYFEGVPLLDAPVALNNLLIKPLGISNLSVGLTFSLLVSITTSRDEAQGSTISIVLPSAYQFQEPQVDAVDLNGQTSSLAGIISVDKRVMTIKSYPYSINAQIPVNFTIPNILVTENGYNMLIDSFRASVIHQDYPQTLECLKISPNISISPQKLNLTISPDSVKNYTYFVGQLTFRIINFLYSSGQIFIYFDSQIRLRKSDCQVVSGITGGQCNVNNLQNRIEIVSFSEANPHVDIVVLFKALSPNNAGNYNISVEVKDQKKNSALGFGATALNVQQDQSFVILRALMTQPPVAPFSGEFTLLYFTFQFNNPLPPSNITSLSKITIEINPAIPSPDAMLKKRLKCMFLMVTQSPLCEWNNAQAGKTIINIQLPSFQIPSYLELEVSAYDPETNDFMGIPVFPRDINYNLVVTTSLNNIVNNYNAYKTNFVPNPRVLPDSISAKLFSNEADQVNGMILTFAAPNELMRGKDYNLVITFVNSRNVWNSTLGYELRNEIYDYPCWIIGKPSKDQLACTLNTATQFSDPQIKVFGIGDLSDDGLVDITFPKVLLSSQGINQDIKIRIEISESIPSVLSNYPTPVTIFYKDIFIGNVVYSSVSQETSSNDFSFTFQNTQPSVISAGNVTFLNLSTNPLIILVQMTKDSVLVSTESVTQEGVSIIYANGVDRAIFYRKASFRTNLTFPLQNRSVINPQFKGPFNYTSIFYSAYFSVLRKLATTFSFLSTIQINSFAEVPTGVYVIQGKPNLFITRFSIKIGYPSAIVWEYQNFNISNDAIPYCKFSTNVAAKDIRGLICERISDSSFKLTNFQNFIGDNTNIEAVLKLAPSSANGRFKITTFLDEDLRQILEESNYQNISLSFVPTTSNIQEFSLLRFTILETNVWVSQPFKFAITGDENCFKVRVHFPFNVTLDNGTSVCLMNNTITQCTVEQTPKLIITFISLIPLKFATTFQFQIGTGRSATGLNFNLAAGNYELNFQLLDLSDNLRGSEKVFMLFNAGHPENFTARSLVNNGNFSDTIWEFTVMPNFQIEPYDGGINLGRIKFMFPTISGGFLPNLVNGSSPNQQIPCVTYGFIPLASLSIKCMLRSSTRSGFPAYIEVINFAQIPANSTLIVRVANIFQHSQLGNNPEITLVVACLSPPTSQGIVTNYVKLFSNYSASFSPIQVINETNGTLPLYLNRSSLGLFDANNSLTVNLNPVSVISNNSIIEIVLPQHIDFSNSTIICNQSFIDSCEIFDNFKTILVRLSSDISQGPKTLIILNGFSTSYRLYSSWMTIKKHVILNGSVVQSYIQRGDTMAIVGSISDLTATAAGLSSVGISIPKNKKGQYIEFHFLLPNAPSARSIVFDFQMPGKISENSTLYCYSRIYVVPFTSDLSSKAGSSQVPCSSLSNGSKLIVNNFQPLQTKNARIRMLIPVNFGEESEVRVKVSSYDTQDEPQTNPIDSGTTVISLGSSYGLNMKTTSKVFDNRVLRAGDRAPFFLNFVPSRLLSENTTIDIMFRNQSEKQNDVNFHFNSSQLYSLLRQIEDDSIVPSSISLIRSKTLRVTLKSDLFRNTLYSLEIGTYNDINETQTGFLYPNIIDTIFFDFIVKDQGSHLIESIPIAINLKPKSFVNSTVQSLNLNANSKGGIILVAFTPTDSMIYNEFRIKIFANVNNSEVLKVFKKNVKFYSSNLNVSLCSPLGEISFNKATFIIACNVSGPLLTQEYNIFIEFRNRMLQILEAESYLTVELELFSSNGILFNYDFLPNLLIFKNDIVPLVIPTANLTNIEIGQLTTLYFSIPSIIYNNQYLVISPDFTLRTNSRLLNCTPNCTVRVVGNQLLVTSRANIDAGTQINITGILNPSFVENIGGITFSLTSSLQRRFNNIYQSNSSILSQSFATQNTSNFDLDVQLLPSNRKSLITLELTVLGNFIGTKTAIISLISSIPFVGGVLALQSENSQIGFSSSYNNVSRQIKIIFNDTITGNKKFELYLAITILPNNTQQSYLFNTNLDLYQNLDFTNAQFFGSFPAISVSQDSILSDTFDDTFYVFSSSQFINKKNTLDDPNCCHFVRFITYFNNTLQNNTRVIVKLLNDHLQYPPYPSNTSTLCYINSIQYPCLFTNFTHFIQVEMRNVKSPDFGFFDVQIGFRNPVTGQLSGFYIDTETVMYAAIEVFNSTSLITNVLSQNLVLKPERLPKFNVISILTTLRNQTNAIEFVANADGLLLSTDTLRMVLEFEITDNSDANFKANLGNFEDGAKVPCMATGNLQTSNGLTCVFIKGTSYENIETNAQIYIEGFSIVNITLDFSFIIAGFVNPSRVGSTPTFSLNIYKKVGSSYFIKGYNELYDSLIIQDLPRNLRMLKRESFFPNDRNENENERNDSNNQNQNPNNYQNFPSSFNSFNSIDIDGNFYNNQTNYSVTFNISLGVNDSYLIILDDNTESCLFKEEYMVGFIGGQWKRLLWKKVTRNYVAGRPFNFNTFYCTNTDLRIAIMIFQANGVVGEVQNFRFPNRTGFVDTHNERIVSNSDMIVSMNMLQANSLNVRTIEITSAFSQNFLNSLVGFYQTKYGMVAEVLFTQPIFGNVFACYVTAGFASSDILVPLNCRVESNQKLVIRNFNQFALIEQNLGRNVSIVVRASLNNSVNYNSLNQKYILRVYYDSNSRNNSCEFLILQKSVSQVILSNRRMLADLTTATLISKIGNDYLVNFSAIGTIFTQTNDTLSRVTLTFLGNVSNISSVKIQLSKPTLSNSTCTSLLPGTFQCLLNNNVLQNFIGTFEFAIEPITITKINNTVLVLDQKSMLVNLVKTSGQNYYYMVMIKKDPSVVELDPLPPSNTTANTSNTTNSTFPSENSVSCALSRRTRISAIGESWYSVFEARVKAINLTLNISTDNTLAVLFYNWNFTVFSILNNQPRIYPCSCNYPANCYYYPPKSVYPYSPFVVPSILVSFGIQVSQGSTFDCFFPVLRQQVNSTIRVLVLPNSNIQVDENNTITSLADCSQNFTNPPLPSGETLRFKIVLTEVPNTLMNITLTSLRGQFMATDIVYINFGEKIISGNQDQTLICTYLTNCRVYNNGSVIIVGNPFADCYDLIIPFVNFSGFYVDNSETFIQVSFHDIFGRLRNIENASIPNSDALAMLGNVLTQNYRPWKFSMIVFTLQFQIGNYYIQTGNGGFILVHVSNFVKFVTRLCSAYVGSNRNESDNFACQIFSNNTIKIRADQADINPFTAISVVFRAQMMDDVPRTLRADVYTIQTGRYSEYVMTTINISSVIPVAPVISNPETHFGSMLLYDLIRVGETYRDGPLKIEFNTDATNVRFNRIVVKSLKQISGFYPICWLNIFNLTNRITPIFAERTFCTLNRNSLIINETFAANSFYQVTISFSQNPNVNTLLNFAELTNFNWNYLFENETVTVDFMRGQNIVQSGSRVVQQSRQLGQFIKILSANVSSSMPSQPKTIEIILSFNNTMQPSSDAYFDVVFPPKAYTGYCTAWSQNGSLISPEVSHGDLVDCSIYIMGSTIPVQPVSCIFVDQDGSSPRIRVPFTQGVLLNAPVFLAVYNILGPNTQMGIAGIEIEFSSLISNSTEKLYRTFIETLLFVDNRVPQITYVSSNFSLLRSHMMTRGTVNIDASTTLIFSQPIQINNIDAILEPPGDIWVFNPNTISFKIEGVEGRYIGMESVSNRFHFRFDGVSINSSNVLIRISRYNHSEDLCSFCQDVKITLLERKVSSVVVATISYPEITAPFLSQITLQGLINIESFSNNLQTIKLDLNLSSIDSRTVKFQIQFLKSEMDVYGIGIGNTSETEFSEIPARLVSDSDFYSIEILTANWKPRNISVRGIIVTRTVTTSITLKFNEYNQEKLIRGNSFVTDQFIINLSSPSSLLELQQFRLSNWRNMTIARIARSPIWESFFYEDQLFVEFKFDSNVVINSSSEFAIKIPPLYLSSNSSAGEYKAVFLESDNLAGFSTLNTKNLRVSSYAFFNVTDSTFRIAGPVSGRLPENFILVLTNVYRRVKVFPLTKDVSIYISVSISRNGIKQFNDAFEYRYPSKLEFPEIKISKASQDEFADVGYFSPLQVNISGITSVTSPTSDNRFIRISFPFKNIGLNGLNLLQSKKVKGSIVCTGIKESCQNNKTMLLDYSENGNQILYSQIGARTDSLTIDFPMIQNPFSPSQFIAQVEYLENVQVSWIPRVLARKIFVIQENIRTTNRMNILPFVNFQNFYPRSQIANLSISFRNPNYIHNEENGHNRTNGSLNIVLNISRTEDCISNNSLLNAEINGNSIMNYVYDYRSFHVFWIPFTEQENVTISFSNYFVIQNSNCQVSVRVSAFSDGKLLAHGESHPVSNGILTDSNGTNRFFWLVHGNPGIGSHAIYQLNFLSNLPYPRGSNLRIKLPFSSSEPNQVLIYNYCFVKFGLQNAPGKTIKCDYVSSDELLVSGFEAINTGDHIGINFGANPNSNPQAFIEGLPYINVTSPEFDIPFAKISGFTGLLNGTRPFNLYFNRTIIVDIINLYPGRRQNLVFQLNTTQPIVFYNYNNNFFELVIDSAFVIDPRANITANVRKVNTTQAWLNFPGQLFAQFPNSILRFKVENLSQFDGNTSYTIRLNVESSNGTGIIIPKPGDYFFDFSIVLNTTIVWSVPTIMKVLPQPQDDIYFNYTPSVRESSKFSYGELTTVLGKAGIEIGDEIWVEYPLSNNLGMQFFDQSLGNRWNQTTFLFDRNPGSSPITRVNKPMFCSMTLNLNSLETGGCSLKGGLSTDTSAFFFIKPNSLGSNSSQLKTTLGPILNPPIALYKANFQISLRKVCRDDGREFCPVNLLATDYLIQQRTSLPNISSTLQLSDYTVSATNVVYSFSFNANFTFSNGDFVYLLTPEGFSPKSNCLINGVTQECSWSQYERILVIKLKQSLLALVTNIISVSFNNRPRSCVLAGCTSLNEKFVVYTTNMQTNQIVSIHVYDVPNLNALTNNNPVSTVLPYYFGNSSNATQAANANRYWVSMTLTDFFETVFVDTLSIQLSCCGEIPCCMDFIFDSSVSVNATFRTTNGSLSNQNDKYPDVFKASFTDNRTLVLSISQTFKAKLSEIQGSNQAIVYFRIIGNYSSSNPVKFVVNAYQSSSKLLRRSGISQINVTNNFNSNSTIPSFNMKVVRTTITGTYGNDLIFSINPMTDSRINRIRIDLPNGFTGQFVTNTSFQCSLVGLDPWVVSACFNDQSVNNGNTIFVLLNGYNNQNTTLQIKGQTPFFISPVTPQANYYATLTLYYNSNVVNVFKLAFNDFFNDGVSNIQFKTLFHHGVMSPIDISFDSPVNTSIIPGYFTNSTNISSRIIVEFPETEGWDLQLGLSTQEKDIDCYPLNYQSIFANLRCLLVQGSLDNNPQIHLINYEIIPKNTTGIQILIGDILLPFSGFNGGLFVKIDYFQRFFHRDSFPAHEPIFYSLSGLQSISLPNSRNQVLSVQGSNQSASLSTLIFGFELQTNLGVNDAVEFEIDERIFDPELGEYSISNDFGGSLFTFQKQSKVLVRNFSNGIPSGTVVWRLFNVPKVPYSFNSTVSVKMRILQNRNVAFVYNFAMNLITIPLSSFNLFNVNFSSFTGGSNGENITIHLKTGFTLHQNASLLFTFPEVFGNMNTLNPLCSTNLPWKLSCSIAPNMNNGILIKLVLDDLSPDEDLLITLSSMNIPNNDLTSLGLNLKIFYSQDLDSIVSDANATFPIITISASNYCTMTVTSQFATPNIFNDMRFSIVCSEIKKTTILSIEFPKEYLTSLPAYFVECSAENILLKSSFCQVIPGNIISVQVPLEESPYYPNFTIILRDIKNPDQGTYSFGVTATSNFFDYGKIETKPNLTFTSQERFNTNPMVSQGNYIIPLTPSEIATHIAFIGKFNFFELTTNFHLRLSRHFSIEDNIQLACGFFLFDNIIPTFNLSLFKYIVRRQYSIPCSFNYDTRSVVIPIPGMVKSSTQNVAWIINGIRNPISYVNFGVFIHYEIAGNMLIWQNGIPINGSTWGRPRGLRVQSSQSSVFTLNSLSTLKTSLLPFEISAEQFETSMTLSKDYDGNQNNTLLSCINNQANVNCSIDQLTVFINQSSFSFGTNSFSFLNLRTPKASPVCSINPTVSSKVNTLYSPFNFTFLGKQSLGLLYKTYSLINNVDLCLPYKLVKGNALVNGSLVVYNGLKYNYTVKLTQRTSNLQIAIKPQNSNITVVPSVLVFKDLPIPQLSFTIGIPMSIPIGQMIINFESIDPEEQFEDVPPLILYVGLPNDLAPTQVHLQPIPFLENNNMTQFLNFYLDDFPPIEVQVDIDKGNYQGVSLNQSSFKFTPLIKNFTVIIRVLPSENDLIVLKIAVNQSAGRIPYFFSGSPLQIMIKSGSTFGSLNLNFTSKKFVSVNSAYFEVCFNKPSIGYSVITYANSRTPSIPQIIGNESNPVIQKYHAQATTPNADASKFCTIFSFTGLTAQTNYTIYVTGSDSISFTEVISLDFTTSQIDVGVVFSLFFSKNQSVPDLINSISIALNVNSSRIIPLSSSQISNSTYEYDFVLAPDPFNNDISPSDLIQRLYLNGSQNLFENLFDQNFTGNDSSVVTLYTTTVPQVAISPVVYSRSYYNVTFKVQLSGPGKVFAVRIATTDIQRSSNFTKQQIYMGLQNDNTQFPTKYFAAKNSTNSDNTVFITFDDLRPVSYEFYFVVTDNKVYNPPTFSTMPIIQYSLDAIINPNAL